MNNLRRHISGLYGRAVLLSALLLAITSCGDSPTGTPKPAPVASVDVTAPAATLAALDSVTLSVVARDAAGAALTGRAMQWSSSDPAVGNGAASGRASGEAPGTATVTATAEGQSGSVTLTVTGARVASLTLGRDTATLQAGTTLGLAATPRDRAGGALSRVVSWSSSNAAVASVDAAGAVRAMAPGTAVVTATSEGSSARATITVVPAAIASLAIIPGEGTMVVGGSVPLQVEARDALGNVLAGRSVEIAVDNPAVAALEAGGVLRGTGVGTVTVTATAEGRTAQANFTVNPAPVASVQAIASAPAVLVGNTVVVNAIARDGNGNALTGRAVAWATSNAAVATVSGQGVVTGVSPGTVALTATVEGRSGSVEVAVQPRPVFSVQVAPGAPTLYQGRAVELSAIARDEQGGVLTGRAATWSTSDPAVATVSATGVVTGVAVGGPVAITATVEGRTGTAQVTIVPPPVASVEVGPRDASVVVGSTGQLSAVARDDLGNVLTGRAVTWRSDDPAVATVGAAGVVSGEEIGATRAYATIEGVTGSGAVIVTASTEREAPTITGLVVTPSRIDVWNAPQTVTLRATVADAGTGVGRLVATLRTPDGSGELAAEARAPVSGTRANGVFEVSSTFPAGSAVGDWPIELSVRDRTGNTRRYSAAELAALDFTSFVRLYDTRSPSLLGLTLTSATFKVSSEAQTFTVLAEVSDAGVGAFDAHAHLRNTSETSWIHARGSSTPMSGTRAHGVFQVNFTIPAGTPAGDQMLYVTLADMIGNTRTYTWRDLQAMGLAYKVTITP